MAKRRKTPAILPEQWYDAPYSPEDFAAALTAAQSHAVSMVVSGGALTTSTTASENPATGFSDTSCKVAAALFGDELECGDVDDHCRLDYHEQVLTGAYILGIAAALRFPDLFGALRGLKPTKER